MYIRQIVECGGIPCVEYGHEPEECLDDVSEVSPSPVCCNECDFYVQGKCQLTNQVMNRDTIACPDLKITHPF